MIEVEPIPYSLRNDTVITSLLMLCFLIAVLAIGHIRGYIMREITSFAYKKDYTASFNTSTEINLLHLLCFQTIILSGIALFIYLRKETPWFYMGVVACYFIGKYILYSIVNWTFFEKRDSSNWRHVIVLLCAIEGILMFPVVILQAYANWDVFVMIVLMAIIIIFFKILTLFKCYDIFFYRNGGFLQIILYLCTLELVPLFLLYGITVK